jgi:hypothetical protein
MEKPKVLYHGSNDKKITEFEPRISKGQGEKFGANVYATHDFATAVVFMSKPHAWMTTGHFHDNAESDFLYVVIATSKEEFKKMDNGGSVYSLPSGTFERNPEALMDIFEWASQVSVKPIDQKNYNSSLDAMIENWVQVYFVNQELFDKIETAPDHGYEILKTLKSENQTQNLNVKIL